MFSDYHTTFRHKLTPIITLMTYSGRQDAYVSWIFFQSARHLVVYRNLSALRHLITATMDDQPDQVEAGICYRRLSTIVTPLPKAVVKLRGFITRAFYLLVTLHVVHVHSV